MEAKAYLKNQRISPKKLRFLLPEIKKMTPSEALTRLFYSPNRSSKIFYSSLKSAVSNAINVLKVDEKVLRFKHLSVEEGQKLKRFRAGGRGTAKPILKRFSHIKIVLEAEEPKIQPIQNSKIKVQNDNTKIKKEEAKKPKVDLKKKLKVISKKQ